MADYGTLVEVQAQPRTAVLVADAAVSDTELVVDDAGDFNASSAEDPDGGGGTLRLGGSDLEYLDITWGDTEDDSDAILLAEPLTAGADEGDSVDLILGGQVAEDWYAVVSMGEGDSVMVPISYAQRSQWAVGIYDPGVPVIVADDLSGIEDAPGRTPGGRVLFRNTDTATAAGSGDLEVLLTYTPIDGSEHVYWNGLLQPPTEWSRVGNALTLDDAGGLLVAGDEVSVHYAYDGGAPAVNPVAVPLTFLGATADIDAWTFPAEAIDGGLLVAVAMVVDTKTPTLNGWTDLGQTDLVTHAASSGTYTYRLIALATTYETGVTTLPTIPSFGLDSVCLMAAFDATGTATVAFDTEADDTTGYAPAISPSSIRVWGTIGNLVTPVPAGGTQIAYEPGSDICLLMTLDESTAPAAATTGTASGWCMASIAVTA